MRATVRSRLDALLASFHAEIAAIADAAAQRDGGGGRARALATAIAHEFGSLRSRHPPLADVLRDGRFAKGLVADGAAPSHEPPPPQLQLRWAVLDTVARLAAGAPADGGDGVWASSAGDVRVSPSLRPSRPARRPPRRSPPPAVPSPPPTPCAVA